MNGTTLTGAAAADYLGAWMQTGRPGRGGLNAARLRRDALASIRSASARARLAAARIFATAVKAGPTASVRSARSRRRRSLVAVAVGGRQHGSPPRRPREATA